LHTAIPTLLALRELGVQLCIDDFGTGYASLSYLQKLPINTLKVDHSFVNQLDQADFKKDAANLVQTIIKLAHDLDITVSAEGVETRSQFQKLADLGCDYAQGCFFSEPVNSQAAAQLLFSS
jgi:EAL domain-containing protein (putative c-di-GMP-specific phosphodiesterase class I)